MIFNSDPEWILQCFDPFKCSMHKITDNDDSYIIIDSSIQTWIMIGTHEECYLFLVETELTQQENW